jgi:hypothetical protein
MATKRDLARFEAEMEKAKPVWARGEWDEEPDRVEWADPKTGLPCLIVRGPLGALCGYVGVPKDHPLYRVKKEALPDLQVHGGVNYAKACSFVICHAKRNDPRWWIGFDCGHSRDLVPGFEPLMRRVDERMENLAGERLREVLGSDTCDRLFGRHYCSVAYVQAECTGLAAQLAAMRK